MKTCSKCYIQQPTTAFYASSLNKDGLEGSCKGCKSLYIKDRWKRDEKYRQKHSLYSVKNRKFSKQEREHICLYCSSLIETKTAPNKTGLCRPCAVKNASHNWTQNNLPLKAAHRAKRRSSLMNRTPKWLTATQLKEIKELYEMAKELQWLSNPTDPLEVDHIVPLQGDIVSGLHVPWNLQILPKSLNCSKANK